MSSALDMSLDDIIKNNKLLGSGNARGRVRGGGGSGPARRNQNRGVIRASQYTTAKAPKSVWNHDLYSDQAASFPSAAQGGVASAIEPGTKLYICNLEYGVSIEDIKELFSEVGNLKRYIIHYDRSGRSKGAAEVVYLRRADAIAAVKRYNNVQLDGKPMKIEIMGTNTSTPASLTAVVGFGNSSEIPRGGQGRGGAFGILRRASRGRGGRGPGRGRGRGAGHDEKLSAEYLDADLEKYHAESMQIN